MKWFLTIIAWWFGTAMAVVLVRSFTTADWTNWFAVIFALVWGGIVIWAKETFF
jgi:hypothetical protein